jgi:hypothetical protein
MTASKQLVVLLVVLVVVTACFVFWAREERAQVARTRPPLPLDCTLQPATQVGRMTLTCTWQAPP